jgi:hypothetical protein
VCSRFALSPTPWGTTTVSLTSALAVLPSPPGKSGGKSGGKPGAAAAPGRGGSALGAPQSKRRASLFAALPSLAASRAPSPSPGAVKLPTPEEGRAALAHFHRLLPRLRALHADPAAVDERRLAHHAARVAAPPPLLPHERKLVDDMLLYSEARGEAVSWERLPGALNRPVGKYAAVCPGERSRKSRGEAVIDCAAERALAWLLL